MIAFEQGQRINFPKSSVVGLSRKPRILFAGESVALAHVGRPALLARWSREHGYDVHFSCGQAFASVAVAEGFTPHHLPTIDAAIFHSRVKAGQFFYTADELDAYVRAELELIEEVQPDLIVGDFRFSLAISTTIAGVPLVSLNNAYWSPAAACRFPMYISAFSFLPASLRVGVTALLRPVAFRVFASPLNIVRRRYGLAPLSDFREHFTAGKFCAYMDLPEFVNIHILPRGHFFLGPVAWEPRSAILPALGSLGTRRPLAYVTLGSTGDARVLPNVMRALLHSDCDIAVTGVSAEDFNALQQAIPELHGRCVAAPLCNPHEVLKRAAVTVCHGGSGTVYQSLASGVPVLCLPSNSDQGLVSAAALALGAGIIVEPRDATSARLMKALESLLNDAQYRTAARSLARVIAGHDTRQCWLKFLNRSLSIGTARSATTTRSTETQPC